MAKRSVALWTVSGVLVIGIKLDPTARRAACSDARDAQSPGRENAQWPGRGRFWCAVLATFASHGYTGVMKSEREVGVGLWVRPRGVTRYGRRSKRRLVTARKRNGPDAAHMQSRWSILVRVFGHVCGPWVHRGAFFRRKMRAVFGRVKTRTREGPCKTM